MPTGKIKFLFTALIFLIACGNAESQKRDKIEVKNDYEPLGKRIGGVNFTAPSRAIDSSWTGSLQQINANWVAFVPYAYSRNAEPNVYYESERQYWGESLTGVKINIKQAHAAGLKVMIKPHVWLRSGWIGDFDLSTEEQWKVWEVDYERYIMLFAKLAAEENAEMICIGTEYRNAAKKRPQFWIKLAKDIRKIYKGKLTYCANWDDYTDVKFWKELDYIGMSGYFPLSEVQTPSVSDLEKAWKPYKLKLKSFASKEGRPILFTEYGYRSMDQAAWRSWEYENQQRPINMEGQANAYEALFKSLWNEKWFAGGFAWKWYSSFRRIDPEKNHDWTPQNKKAQEIMKTYYGR